MSSRRTSHSFSPPPDDGQVKACRAFLVVLGVFGAFTLLAVETLGRVVAGRGGAFPPLFDLLLAYAVLGVGVGIVGLVVDALLRAVCAGRVAARAAVALIGGTLIGLLLLRDAFPPVSETPDLSLLVSLIVAEALVILVVWHGYSILERRAVRRPRLRPAIIAAAAVVGFAAVGWGWTQHVSKPDEPATALRPVVVFDVSGLGAREFQWADSNAVFASIGGMGGRTATFAKTYAPSDDPDVSLRAILWAPPAAGQSGDRSVLNSYHRAGYHTMAVLATNERKDRLRADDGLDRVERFDRTPYEYVAIRLLVAMGRHSVAPRRPDGMPVASAVAQAAIDAANTSNGHPYLLFVRFGDLVGDWTPSADALRRVGWTGPYSGGLAVRSMLNALNGSKVPTARGRQIRAHAREAMHAVVLDVGRAVESVVAATRSRHPIYILTSDHGLTDLDRVPRGVRFPETAVRVPLRIGAGQECSAVDQPIYLATLLSAVLKLALAPAGGTARPPDVCESMTESAPRFGIIRNGPDRAIVTSSWKLECRRGGPCRLFRTDRTGSDAVDVTRSHPEITRRLQSWLLASAAQNR